MKYMIAYYIESTGFGGAEQMLFNLLRGLDRGLWDPVLAYHPHPGIAPLIDKVKDLDINTLPVPVIKGLGDICGMNAMTKTLRELHPTIFHAHLVSNLRCTCGIICAKLAGIGAIVATQHSYQEFQTMRTHRIYTLRVYQKLVSMLVDRYIAVSYKQAELLKKAVIDGNKVKVVRNAVYARDFCNITDNGLLGTNLENNSEKPVVLTVARLDKLKGHRYLIEAAAMIPEAAFLFAGDGTERANFEMLARELNVDDRVVFLGQRDDVPQLLNTCDVFVLPSLLEGLPLSILEAMAASKPVIATDIPGINEIIIDGKNGLLVPPADPNALAEKITLILSDKTFAKRLADSGKERVHQGFSVSKMIKDITDIYKDLLPKTNRVRISNGTR